ncbi:MAG: hypothetical protein ACRD3C_22605 [Vicinamibacterales bacterium]
MSRSIVGATWDDAPHLAPAAKEALWASYPPYQRDARTKGIPQLGAGAIYPVEESFIAVKDFPIPKEWPRGFSLDVGWNVTAAMFFAYDREGETWYGYDCYKRGQAEPPIHAEAIKARGIWIPGVGDCADINKLDGVQFLTIYRNLGLILELANKAVEAGIQDVYTLLSVGRMKIFARRCALWFDEFRLYRRDERGRIVKVNDHLMDCTRYRIRAGISKLATEPIAVSTLTDPASGFGSGGKSPYAWMG